MAQVFSDKPLSVKQLNIGTLYMYAGAATEGQCKVGLYLGKNVYGKHIFYNVGGLLLCTKGNARYVLNEEIELKYLQLKVRDIVKGPMTQDGVTELISKPTIFGVVPFCTTEELCKLVAKKNLLGIPTIQLNINNELNADYVPVKQKEMLIGHLYVSRDGLGTAREGYNASFIYAGRTADKKYKYLCINRRLDNIHTREDFIQCIQKNFVQANGPTGTNYWKKYWCVESNSFKKLYKPLYYSELNKISLEDYLKEEGYLV